MTAEVGQWRLRFLVAHHVAEVEGDRWRAACEGRFSADVGVDTSARSEDIRCPDCKAKTGEA